MNRYNKMNISIPKSLHLKTILIFIRVLYFTYSVQGGALQLDSSNFDKIIGNNDIVFINFYADWCRFSNMLAPTWDEAADKVKQEHSEEGKVVIAKVDCDTETSIASRFHITKYPTLKLLRNGQAAKREYRGQRSADAIASFITEQLRDPITKIKSLNDLKELDTKKRTVVGYFDKENLPEYEVFKKVAMNLKEECAFYAGFGEVVRPMHPPGQSIVAFKSKVTEEDEVFRLNLNSYDELSIWATERCIPIVREITFENAEELTEEGLPFLILFHNKEDTDIVQRYIKVVQNELLEQKQNVNFLTADGAQFAHPLHHLGKSKNDLPIIAIDSFRHMYLFPDIKEMATPGKLKQFLADLYSGKLHREYHYGPDPVSAETKKEETVEAKSSQEAGTQKKPTTPPESSFKKLAPSRNRYTLLEKDEL